MLVWVPVNAFSQTASEPALPDTRGWTGVDFNACQVCVITLDVLVSRDQEIITNIAIRILTSISTERSALFPRDHKMLSDRSRAFSSSHKNKAYIDFKRGLGLQLTIIFIIN